jgi:hypothetical protein
VLRGEGRWGGFGGVVGGLAVDDSQAGLLRRSSPMQRPIPSRGLCFRLNQVHVSRR